MSDVLLTAIRNTGDEIVGATPPAPLTTANFEMSGVRSLGFSYSRTATDLLGLDPDRPELGTIRVSIGGDIASAKMNLMFNLCAGLTTEQQVSRIHLL